MSVRGEDPSQGDASIEAAPSFRVLKAIVIVMGAAIVAGFIVIAVTIFTRSSNTVGRSGGFRTDVAVPAGELVDVTAGGGQIVLRYRTAEGAEHLVLIDQATGRAAGTVTLVPQP